MDNYNLAVYGSGLFGANDPATNQAQLSALQASGFTTVILWALHVQENGDFHYNNTPIVQGGTFASGYSYLPALVSALKTGSSVNQVLFSLGGWGVGDFQNMTNLIATPQGQQTLLDNFSALVKALAIDGFDFDNEEGYSSSFADTIVWLTNHLSSSFDSIITYCPYTAMSFWVDQCLGAVYQQNGKQLVSWFNLQCYAGGAGNNPADWVSAVASGYGISNPNAFIVPGFDAGDQPSGICQDFKGLQVEGGFIWNTSEIFDSSSSPAQYAEAITNGLEGNC